jgi:hypothetical protein
MTRPVLSAKSTLTLRSASRHYRLFKQTIVPNITILHAAYVGGKVILRKSHVTFVECNFVAPYYDILFLISTSSLKIVAVGLHASVSTLV